MTHDAHGFNVRFPPELWARVRDAALDERRSVHQWVLLAVEEKLGPVAVTDDPRFSDGSSAAGVDGAEIRAVFGGRVEPSPAAVEDLIAAGKVSRGAPKRKSMCPHRVPAGSFCKKCD